MDGYKIIDLGGITLEDGEFSGTIEGVYNAIDISTKPIIITGINGYKPFFMGAMEKSSTSPTTYQYMGFMGMSTNGIQVITISDSDEVEITITN